jgi:hypothetical protein
MFSLRNILIYSFLSLFLFSCSDDKSGYVDIPADHGDELKISKAADDITVPRAGNYGNLLFAIDSNKISALYTSKGKSCYFIESDFTKFSAETPMKWSVVGSTQKGEGKLIAEKDAVWIQFNGSSTGCAPELFKAAQKFPLSKINNWKKIIAVNSNSVEISSEPIDAMKIGQSFKKGDIICILEQKNDWLRVEKIAQSPQVGWVKASDLKN